MQVNYLDPFSVWKSIYTEIEPKVSESLQNWLESEEYAAFSGQMLSATLLIEKNYLKAVEQTLQTYSVPTVKDFARLSELVIGLEEKVDEIDERLIRLEKTLPGIQEMKGQLDEIEAQVAFIGQALRIEDGMPDKGDLVNKGRRRSQRKGNGEEAKLAENPPPSDQSQSE